MKHLLSFTIVTLLVSLFLLEGSAIAQISSEKFHGRSWRLISGKIERGGRKLHLTAPGTAGFLVFDSKDHFLLVITRSGPSRGGSRDGQTGSSSENRLSLQKSVTCFGTY